MTSPPTAPPKPRARRMTRRAFWRRFGRLEHEGLEFKSSAARLQESVVAMAMARGGTILIGISDDRRLVGHPLDQEVLDRIALVAHETQVELDVRCLRAGGIAIVAIGVPAVRHRVVTTSDGRILRRLGSANQPVRGDAVARLVQSRNGEAPAAHSVSRPCSLLRPRWRRIFTVPSGQPS
jgi:predicted HTH transcriptional regulator